MAICNVVGQSVTRVDALAKATGHTRYAADLAMPGMLYGRALLSPHAHALVRRIDVSRARALDGVAAVLTRRDLPNLGRYGIYVPDQPVLIGEGERVMFVGDAVALVAAESEAAAERALSLIEVEYEELPGVFSLEEAMAATTTLHPDHPGNLILEQVLAVGDTAAGFAAAEVVVEQEYQTSRQEHAYIEPEAGIAYLDDRGRVVVQSCLQDPYYALRALGDALQMPMSRLRVIATPNGGGFGAKLDLTIQPWLAVLARATRRPVKMALSREDSMRLHPKRHPMRIRMRMGATRDGQIVAYESQVLADGGPYTSRSPTVIKINTSYIPGPYRIPNIRAVGRAYFTNNPMAGAFRGYGAPQAVAAREQTIDLLARRLGADPLELRLRNRLRDGDEPANSMVRFDAPLSLPAVVERAVEAAGPPPEQERTGPRVGRGYCLDMPTFDVAALPSLGMAGAGAEVEVFPDGTVGVATTAVELGQGASTILGQIAAEEMGVPLDQVEVLTGDTDLAPKAGPTSASRQTYVSGNAVRMAAGAIRGRLLQRAARAMEIDAADLTIREGRIEPVDGSARGLPVSEVAQLCFNDGTSLSEQSWFKGTHGALSGHTFMAAVADVAVDEATGVVEVRKLVAVHDSGQAINPAAVAGQLFGGAVQAQGYALVEDLPCARGQVLAPSLSAYLIPTILDVPAEMRAEIVEEAYPTGPFGAKGVGEHALNAVTPAIANAIAAAIGAPVTSLPITPEKVLAVLERLEAEGPA